MKDRHYETAPSSRMSPNADGNRAIYPCDEHTIVFDHHFRTLSNLRAELFVRLHVRKYGLEFSRVEELTKGNYNKALFSPLMDPRGYKSDGALKQNDSRAIQSIRDEHEKTCKGADNSV